MRRLLPVTLAAVALIASACGSGKDSAADGGVPDGGSGRIETLARPAVFSALALVELVAPGRSNAGNAPTFTWKPLSGAGAYRLAVLAPDGPSWSWTGADTSVRYGGVAEGVPGPALNPGSWWSVAALDADDTVIAMSELRAVSPGADLGPAPTWTTVKPATSGAGVASPNPTGGSMGDRICDFLTPDQISAAIDGDWGTGVGETYPTGTTGRCEWTSEHGTLFSVNILGADAYDPAGWNSDGDLTGLGEKAFWARSPWDLRIGFVKGDLSVTLVIDFTRVDPAGFTDLAHLVEEQLP